MKPRILFVCTNNAGRSQMAETVFQNLCGNDVEVSSAGVDPWPDIHPMAKKLMAERGHSMSGEKPKHVNTFLDSEFDYVVTIGAPAKTQCPELPGNPVRIHWDIGDPARGDGGADSETIFRETLKGLDRNLAELKNTILPL